MNEQVIPTNNTSISFLSQDQPKNSELDQWNVLYKSIKNGLEGTEQEKQILLRKRLLKFFHNYSLEQSRFYVPRRQIETQNNPLVSISNNCLLLYGIDFMSEHKINSYFNSYTVNIQFYDDSHCAVSFQNYQQLKQAIFGNMNICKEDYSTYSRKIASYPTLKLQWIELKPYNQMCFERKLWGRFLSNQDIKSNNQQRSTVHSTYLLAKSKFLNDLTLTQTSNLLFNKSIENSSFQKSKSRSRSRSRQKLYHQNKLKTSYNENFKICPCKKQMIRYVQSNCCGCNRFHHNNYYSRNESIDTMNNRNKYNMNRGKKQSCSSKLNHQYKSNRCQPIDQIKKITSYQTNSENVNRNNLISSNKTKKLETFSNTQKLAGKDAQTSIFCSSDDDKGMIDNLMKELDKYHFDEEQPNFDDSISMNKSKIQSEYSIFEMIEEE